MSENYKANTDLPYFVTFTLQGWVDLFTKEVYLQLLTENLQYCYSHKQLIVHEYVLMSSHAHLILQHHEHLLAETIRDYKKHTAKVIVKCIQDNDQESRREWLLRLFKYYAQHQKQNKEYSVWRKTNRPIALDNADIYNRCLNYIHQNPVKAGLVLAPHHWRYSSACEDKPLSNILGKDAK